MKKIKSGRQLRAEKKRLKQRQAELEHRISRDWISLKEEITTLGFLKTSSCKESTGKKQGDENRESFLASALRFGFDLAARKFAGKAGEKIERFFRKK